MNKEVYNKIKTEIYCILKRQKKYSFNKILSKFDMLDENIFCNILLDILYDVIDKYNFKTPIYYNKYLLKIFDFLNKNNSNKEKIEEILIQIRTKIDKQFIYPNDKQYIESKAFLLIISNNLSSLINLKEDKNEEYSQLHNLIKNIVSQNNSNCFETLINIYPDLIYLKDDNKLLYEEILDRYMNILINKNDDNEILAYNKIILKYIEEFKREEDEETIQFTIHKISKILDNLDEKNYSDEKISDIYIQLKEILVILKNENYSKKEKIETLRKKYKIVSKPVEKISVKPNWKLYKKSRDFVFTIDDENAKVLEQAYSIDILNNIYKLTFYITDLSSYIDENITLEDKVINSAISISGMPIFSKNVANKYFSLNKGKKSYTIAYTFYLNNELEVIDLNVERKLIKVKENLKVSELKKLLITNRYSKLKKKIYELFFLSVLFERKNNNSKYKYHYIKEITSKILFDDSNRYFKPENKQINTMLDEFQIFFNSYFSNYCYCNNLPYIYRNNHLSISENLINDLIKKLNNGEEYDELTNALKQMYSPSFYSTTNEGHDGLNLDSYGEMSKPVRSAVSLLNQKLINMYLIDNVVLKEEDKQVLINELNKKVKIINDKKDLYEEYFYELNKIKKLEREL